MEDKLIDYEGALDRLGGDADFLAELLGEMAVLLDTQVETLVNAVENENYDEVLTSAHGLKGASANLDITRMVRLFKEIEQEGRDKKLVNSRTLLEEVKQSNKELHQFIENL